VTSVLSVPSASSLVKGRGTGGFGFGDRQRRRKAASSPLSALFASFAADGIVVPVGYEQVEWVVFGCTKWEGGK
jgi:hypothetical protein